MKRVIMIVILVMLSGCTADDVINPQLDGQILTGADGKKYLLKQQRYNAYYVYSVTEKGVVFKTGGENK